MKETRLNRLPFISEVKAHWWSKASFINNMPRWVSAFEGAFQCNMTASWNLSLGTAHKLSRKVLSCTLSSFQRCLSRG